MSQTAGRVVAVVVLVWLCTVAHSDGSHDLIHGKASAGDMRMRMLTGRKPLNDLSMVLVGLAAVLIILANSALCYLLLTDQALWSVVSALLTPDS